MYLACAAVIPNRKGELYVLCQGIPCATVVIGSQNIYGTFTEKPFSVGIFSGGVLCECHQQSSACKTDDSVVIQYVIAVVLYALRMTVPCPSFV
jgi:hypothetical protein